MKLGIILGIILGIVITVIAAVVIVFLLVLPATREVSSGSGPAVTTPVATAAPTTGTSNSTPYSPLPTSGTSPAQTPASTANVNFSLNIPSVTISGITSVDISAQLTNTGREDVHNVTGKIEVLYQGSRIKINGQDDVILSLGTIKAGETITRQVKLSFGLFDGLKISQGGATFNLTITSDEKTETVSYDYKP
jgi:hypothetical protein